MNKKISKLTEEQQEIEDERHYTMRQENIYWGKSLLHKAWYRSLYGGTWRYLKIGKDTPNIGIFSVWTKTPRKWWSGYTRVLEREDWVFTGADTKKKVFIQLIKYIFRK